MFFINAFMRNHQVPCWILVCKPFQKLSSRHLPKRHRSYPLRPVHWAGQPSGVWKKGARWFSDLGQHASLIFREKTTNNLLAVALSNPSLWYIDIILKLAWDELFEIAIIEYMYHTKNRIRETWAWNVYGLKWLDPWTYAILNCLCSQARILVRWVRLRGCFNYDVSYVYLCEFEYSEYSSWSITDGLFNSSSTLPEIE